jgi:hypothetical protein
VLELLSWKSFKDASTSSTNGSHTYSGHSAWAIQMVIQKAAITGSRFLSVTAMEYGTSPVFAIGFCR